MQQIICNNQISQKYKLAAPWMPMPACSEVYAEGSRKTTRFQGMLARGKTSIHCCLPGATTGGRTAPLARVKLKTPPVFRLAGFFGHLAERMRGGWYMIFGVRA